LGDFDEHAQPSFNELSNLSRNFVTEHPDLVMSITFEASYSVWQEPSNDIHQAPYRWIRESPSIFGGFLDLHKAAAINSSFDPAQIKIVLPLRANRGTRPMVIEMVEQQIQDNRGLIVETTDCTDPT